MKTIDEIRDAVAFKHGFGTWANVLWQLINGPSKSFKNKPFNDLEKEAIEEYASLALQEKEKEIVKLQATVEDRENIVKFLDQRRNEMQETQDQLCNQVQELRRQLEELRLQHDSNLSALSHLCDVNSALESQQKLTDELGAACESTVSYLKSFESDWKEGEEYLFYKNNAAVVKYHSQKDKGKKEEYRPEINIGFDNPPI